MRRLAMQMSRQLREDAQYLSRNGGDHYRVSLLYARAQSIEESGKVFLTPYPIQAFSFSPSSDN